jgi:hypothetical protein
MSITDIVNRNRRRRVDRTDPEGGIPGRAIRPQDQARLNSNGLLDQEQIAIERSLPKPPPLREQPAYQGHDGVIADLQALDRRIDHGLEVFEAELDAMWAERRADAAATKALIAAEIARLGAEHQAAIERMRAMRDRLAGLSNGVRGLLDGSGGAPVQAEPEKRAQPPLNTVHSRAGAEPATRHAAAGAEADRPNRGFDSPDVSQLNAAEDEATAMTDAFDDRHPIGGRMSKEEFLAAARVSEAKLLAGLAQQMAEDESAYSPSEECGPGDCRIALAGGSWCERGQCDIEESGTRDLPAILRDAVARNGGGGRPAQDAEWKVDADEVNAGRGGK